MESAALDKYQDISSLIEESTKTKATVPVVMDTALEMLKSSEEEKIDVTDNTIRSKEKEGDRKDESSDGEFDIFEYHSSGELSESLKQEKAKLEKRQSKSSWVQCDNGECSKWRRLDHLNDLSSVQCDSWVCSMNKDEFRNNCECSQESIPDESDEEVDDESIYTNHKPGDLVLAKMVGYPWWPGIVEDDPDFDSYFYLEKKNGKRVVSYHVTFLGKEVSRAWFAESSVASFDGHETLTDLGQLSYRGKSFKRTVEKALENAKTALAYSPEKRVSRFGFLRRYRGKDKPLDKSLSNTNISKESTESSLSDQDIPKKQDNNAKLYSKQPVEKKAHTKAAQTNVEKIPRKELKLKDKESEKIKRKEEKRLKKKEEKKERRRQKNLEKKSKQASEVVQQTLCGSSKSSFETSKTSLETSKTSLETSETSLKTSETSLETSETSLETSKTSFTSSKTSLELSKTSLESSKMSLESSYETSKTSYKTSNSSLESSKTSLDSSIPSLGTSKSSVDNSFVSFEDAKAGIKMDSADSDTENLIQGNESKRDNLHVERQEFAKELTEVEEHTEAMMKKYADPQSLANFLTHPMLEKSKANKENKPKSKIKKTEKNGKKEKKEKKEKPVKTKKEVEAKPKKEKAVKTKVKVARKVNLENETAVGSTTENKQFTVEKSKSDSAFVLGKETLTPSQEEKLVKAFLKSSSTETEDSNCHLKLSSQEQNKITGDEGANVLIEKENENLINEKEDGDDDGVKHSGSKVQQNRSSIDSNLKDQQNLKAKKPANVEKTNNKISKKTLPKLSKTEIPKVSTDAIIKAKENSQNIKPLPKLKKPSFKAPVRENVPKEQKVPSFKGSSSKKRSLEKVNDDHIQPAVKKAFPPPENTNVTDDIDIDSMLNAEDSKSNNEDTVSASPEF